MERKIAKKIMAMVFAAMLVMLMTTGTTSATITVEGLTQLTNDNYMDTELDITSADDPISIISVEWQDESDNMIVPNDSVDLKVTFKNNLPTTLHNVDVSIESGLCIWADYISSASALEHIGDVSPGREFSIMVPVIIAGVENSCIMNDIINPNGLGTLPLKVTMLTAHVRYDEGEWGDVFDTPTHYLEIQYPDFKPKIDDPYYTEKNDVDNYYMEGDDDFSHTTDLLVRKYAVKAAVHNVGVFPDDPAKVSFNVFRYVDNLLEWDYPKGIRENDLWPLGEKDTDTLEDDFPWICISHAYLFTSLERALGFPAREINVCEGVHAKDAFGPYILYDQNGAAEVWHNDMWNFYDPWTSRSWSFGVYVDKDVLNLSDLLDINHNNLPLVKYRAWYAFDKRTSRTYTGTKTGLDYKGHWFGICKRDAPLLCPYGGGGPLIPWDKPWEIQWKFLKEDSGRKSYVIIAGSPIKMLVKDNQGRMVGSTSTGIVNEIAGADYMPPGQISYSDKGDLDTAFELNEFISVPEYLKGEYELMIMGTGDGEYDLVFAKFDPSSDGEYSDITTVTSEIKENEFHRYEVTIDDTINPVRIPPKNEIPEFPNVAIPAVLILVVFLWLKRMRLK